MLNEQDFYKGLNAVPDMPDSLYPKIEGRIRRQEFVRRTVWVAAVCLIIGVGGFYYHQFSVSRTNQAYAEASEQLQSIGEYFTLQDIQETYPVASDEMEEMTENLSEITGYFNEAAITEDMDRYSIVSMDILQL